MSELPRSNGKCRYCGGNDRNMPCAYPSEGKPGCLRDARLTKRPEYSAGRGVIRRTHLRWWEHHEIWIHPGADLRVAATHERVQLAGGSWLYSAKRAVRKNGKVLGPWLLNINNQACALHGDGREFDRDPNLPSHDTGSKS